VVYSPGFQTVCHMPIEHSHGFKSTGIHPILISISSHALSMYHSVIAHAHPGLEGCIDKVYHRVRRSHIRQLMSALFTRNSAHALQWFLENDPEWSSIVEEIWLWDQYPGRWGPDCGINTCFPDALCDQILNSSRSKCVSTFLMRSRNFPLTSYVNRCL